MARQKLSEKSIRRYSRLSGLPIQSILARGGTGHWMVFRTTDDRHGYIRAPDGAVQWDERPDPHWMDCPSVAAAREARR